MSDPEPVASADAEALDDLRAAWTEGVEEGPWFPAHRPGGPIMLDNKNGDSLFVSAEDATTLVNAFLQPAAIRGTEAVDVERLADELARHVERDGRYTPPIVQDAVERSRLMTTNEFAAYILARLASADSEPS